MPNYLRHRGNQGTNVPNTDRGPSPYIWGDCPWIESLNDPSVGYGQFLDFLNFRTSSNINAAVAHWTDGLQAFGSDGGFITSEDEVGGAVTLGSDGDNEGVSLGSMNFPYQISQSHGKLWFEARVKSSTIADTKHGFFLGLIANPTLSATVPIAAAGTLADVNLVGFHRLEGDGDYVDTVYKADGVTQVSVGTDAQVLVADTYIKLGFVYDPADYYLRFYGNGIELSSTKYIPTAAGTDFPNDVRLGWFFAVLNATGSTPGDSSIDWIRVFQNGAI